MKTFIYLISTYLIFISCSLDNDRAYSFTGNDFAKNQNQNIIGCYYKELDYQVIDKIIETFGENYTYEKNEFEESYKWDNITIQRFDSKPLEIVVGKRNRKIKTDYFECISLKIKKNGKDFFNPMKFNNRNKAKKFLLELADLK